MWSRFGDLHRLVLILLLCAGAGAAGAWLASRPHDRTIAIDQPPNRATLHGLVQVSGWAAEPYPAVFGATDDLTVLLDLPDPVLLGRPLVKLPRAAPAASAAFELGWETCTFPPGQYALRAAHGKGIEQRSSSPVEVTVGACPTPALGLLRADALAEPSAAWPSGGTACLTADYAHTAYRLLRAAAGDAACGAWDSAHVVYGDFLLGLDLELPDAADSAAIGFRARPLVDASPANDAYSGYLLRLDPARRLVRLERHTDAIQPHPVASGRLPRGDPYYAVHILAVNDLISVHVNGRLTLMVRDDGPRWGRLYLGVGGTRAGATALYRDLSLRRAPGPDGDLLARAPDPGPAAAAP